MLTSDEKEQRIASILSNLQAIQRAAKGMEVHARRMERDDFEVLYYGTRMIKQILCDWCEDWD